MHGVINQCLIDDSITTVFPFYNQLNEFRSNSKKFDNKAHPIATSKKEKRATVETGEKDTETISKPENNILEDSENHSYFMRKKIFNIKFPLAQKNRNERFLYCTRLSKELQKNV